MNQKEQMMKKIIIIFLTVVFCLSVFLIAAGKYGLWNLLFPVEDKEQRLEIISENTQWKHLESKKEPGVGNVWTTQDYKADDWEILTGEFNEKVDKSGAATAFFRYEFDLEDAGKYKYMEGTIQYADAVIVYLNGNIIFAGNVPDGGYYSNLDMGACNNVNTPRQSSFVVTDLDNLVTGKNVISVEVHRKDVESQNINFYFQNLNVLEREYKEAVPDTDGLILQKGEKADAVNVNWLTDLPESYKIEYMEGTLETVKKSTFSKYAQIVIMGNTELSDKTSYQKTGQINRLKERTDYVYRVVRIGGKKASKLYQFRTAKKQETSFLYPGILQVDSLSNAVNVSSWKNRLKTVVNISDKPDYLITGKLINTPSDSLSNELSYRSAPELKEIPSIISEVKPLQKENDTLITESRAYMDLLMISLNTNDKDYDGVRQYIKNITTERNRKWNIVILNASEITGPSDIDKNYLEIFKELDIDFVLVNGSTGYSCTFSGGSSENEDKHNYTKKQGETLYTYGGDMAVFVHVSTREVEIKVYNIKNKKLTEEMHLKKPD